MHLLISDVNDKVDCFVPSFFIKNKYSKIEYKLIKKGLKKFYNINSFDIYYSENGKPYLKDLDINISISHDENLVCVLLSKKNVGVDLQYIKTVKSGFKNLLNIPIDYNDVNSLIEFSKRETIIKILNLKLNEINNLDLSSYKFRIYVYDTFFIVCAFFTN